jgi:predicted permease
MLPFRQAFRSLARAPGFAVLAVLAMALGIGANSAIFSVVHGVLLAPLPYPDAERLVQVTTADPELQLDNAATSWPRWELLRGRDDLFQSIGAGVGTAFTVTGGELPERINGMHVTASFFPTLGLAPQLGRGFTEAEDLDGAGAGDVVVLSHAYWQQHFDGREDVLGATLVLDGRPYTVIGVMPRRLSSFPLNQVQAWTPRPRAVSFMAPVQIDQGAYFLNVVGRLAPGVEIEQARAAVAAIDARYDSAHPGNVDVGTRSRVVPLLELLVGDQRGPFALLFGAVACLLLLAAANVANLVLSRHVGRTRQFALRLAVGARRRHVIGELVTENLLLCLVGAAIGLLLAQLAIELLRTQAVAVPRFDEVGLDATVVAFALALAVICGLVLGLLPALQLRGLALGAALREAGRENTAGRGQQRLRAGLMVGQVALSFVLLAAAGLLVLSAFRLAQVEPGFQPEGVLTGFAQVPADRYPDGSEALANFYGELQARLAAIPGVERAAVGDNVPLNGFAAPAPFAVVGRPIPPLPEQDSAQRRIVSAGWFSTLGIPLLRGRDFGPQDTPATSASIIVNESFARRAFGGEEALGRRVVTGMGQREATIIGVVGDIRSVDLATPPSAEMYHPTAQRPENFAFLLLRTAGDPAAQASAMRRALADVDPTIALTNVEALPVLVAQADANRHLTADLLVAFALTALMLAAFGVYAVMAYGVGQRRAEFGIRLAIGAAPSTLRGMVVRQGLWLAAVGVGIGMVVALSLAHAMRGMLFGVEPGDPATYAAIALGLLAIVAAASWVPARRAARVPASEALRG